MPAVGDDWAEAGIIGRAGVVAHLQRFLDDATSSAAVLVLEGDPGVGKTALWRRTLQEASGLIVLRCAPSEAEMALPFAGLGDLLDTVADDVLFRLAPAQQHAVEVALCRRVPDPDGMHASAVSRGLVTALQLLAAQAPVLLAVDDVQWLDAATAQALQFSLRRTSHLPVSLLMSCRTGEVSARAFFSGLPHETLHIGPLDLDGIDDLLHISLGRRLRLPGLLEVQRLSGGNALHAVEVARAAVEAGVELAPGSPLPVPRGLERLLRERTAQLDGRLLAMVAALSRATVPLLMAAAGPDAPAGVAAAAQLGLLVRSGDRVRFAHPLYASVALDALDDESRRALHSRLAAVVEDSVERARHVALSTVQPDAVAAQVCEAAAETARRRGAPHEAAVLLEHALRLTPAADVGKVTARAVQAAYHYEASGASAQAASLLEAVLPRVPAGPMRVPALVGLAVALTSSADGREKAKLRYTQAIAEAGDDADAAAEVRQVLAWELAANGRTSDARTHARTCLGLADRVTSTRLAAGCLAIAALVEYMDGHGASADAFDRALALEPGPPSVGAWPHPYVINPLWASATQAAWSDDLDRSRDLVAQLRAAYEMRGDILGIAECDGYDIVRHVRAGQWQRARELARCDVQFAVRYGQLNGEPMSLWLLSLVEAYLGLDSARGHAERGRDLARLSDQPFVEVQCTAVLGFLELAAGEVSAAWRHLAALPDRLTELGSVDPGFQRCTADAIEAAVAAGELDEARRLVGRFAAQAARARSAWGAAAVLRCHGALCAADGQLGEARGLLDESIALHEQLGQPFELARTLLVAGAIARRSRAKARARRHLERAADLFAALPAPTWLARAHAESDRLGSIAASPFALTATELRVAELVAQGRSNAEVAAALFVTTKTVEWNLSKVYRKVGVRSRAELAAQWPLEF